MSLWERLFLAGVLLVAGAVILVALGALGVVEVPYLGGSGEEGDPAGDGSGGGSAYALPPPPPERDVNGLLAELGAYEDAAGRLPPPPAAGEEPDAAGPEEDDPEPSSDGGAADSVEPGDGGGAKKRDPLVDQMKAKVDLTDAGQVLAFLISTFTARGSKLGEEDLEFLFTALGEQEDFGVRNLLFAHLERIGGSGVTEGVLEFIAENEKNPRMVARALQTLSRQADGDAVQGLVNVMAGDGNRKLREVAFRSLLGTKSAEATRPLLEALGNTNDPAVKRFALAALSQLGGAAGANAVLRYANSQSKQDRSLGVKSLRDIRSPAAVPVLTDSLSRPSSPQVRQEVLRALGRIRDPAAIRPVGNVALYGESRTIRNEAIRTLAVIGRTDAVPTLQSIVNTDQDRVLTKNAARAIHAIQKQEQRRLSRPPTRRRGR